MKRTPHTEPAKLNKHNVMCRPRLDELKWEPTKSVSFKSFICVFNGQNKIIESFGRKEIVWTKSGYNRYSITLKAKGKFAVYGVRILLPIYPYVLNKKLNPVKSQRNDTVTIPIKRKSIFLL